MPFSVRGLQNGLVMGANAQENALVEVVLNPREALGRIDRLRRMKFPMANVSVAAHDAEAAPVAYYGNGGSMRYRGRLADFWNELWQSLAGAGCFNIPGIGTVLVAGPLAGWMLASLDHAALFSGLSPIGAGLYSIGIPRSAIAGYECALKEGKCLVLICGAADEVADAKHRDPELR